MMKPIRLIKVSLSITGLFLTSAVTLAKEPQTEQSFFGNSYPGKLWVQNDVEALVIGEDGLIYTNSGWDEAGREAGIYRDGRPVGLLDGLHGWGRRGGAGIALAGDYVYAAMSQAGGYKYPDEDYPPPGEKWFGVARYRTDGKEARWRGGRGYAGSLALLSKEHPVTGLVRYGDRIAVAVSGENAVFLLDANTMETSARWEVDSPGALVVWGDTLWCLPTNGGPILEIGPDGQLTGRNISSVPEAKAIAAGKDRLYVADGGRSQQILVFDSDLQETGRIGEEAGVFAEPSGKFGEARFHGISALGVDPTNGNLIIAETGGPSAYEVGNGLFLSAYTPEGKRLWQVHSLEFLDRGALDPAEESLILTKDTLYQLDRPLTESGPAASPVATTLDSQRFPHDPRLHIQFCSADVVRVNGHRLMALIGQRAEDFAVFRFEGDTAVPVAWLSRRGAHGSPPYPPGARQRVPYRWQDANGNGLFDEEEFSDLPPGRGWAWHLGENGDIWSASDDGRILHFPLESWNEAGIPMWASKPVEHRLPAGLLSEVNRIEFDGDALYVGGYSEAHPKPKGDWGLIGSRLLCIKGFPEEPKVVWDILLPYDGPEVPANRRKLPKALDVEEGLVFVGYVTGAEIDVFDAADGRPLTTLRPGSAVDNISGWLDIPYAIRAHRRKSGDWLVIAEEVWRGKNMLYKLEDPR
jgi:hypothetical protein